MSNPQKFVNYVDDVGLQEGVVELRRRADARYKLLQLLLDEESQEQEVLNRELSKELAMAGSCEDLICRQLTLSVITLSEIMQTAVLYAE
jgi:hypothetical protein